MTVDELARHGMEAMNERLAAGGKRVIAGPVAEAFLWAVAEMIAKAQRQPRVVEGSQNAGRR